MHVLECPLRRIEDIIGVRAGLNINFLGHDIIICSSYTSLSNENQASDALVLMGLKKNVMIILSRKIFNTPVIVTPASNVMQLGTGHQLHIDTWFHSSQLLSAIVPVDMHP